MVLFLGGAQDVIARTVEVSVGHVTAALQWSLLVVPPVVLVVALRLCDALARRDPPERTERSEVVRRTDSGGFDIDSGGVDIDSGGVRTESDGRAGSEQVTS